MGGSEAGTAAASPINPAVSFFFFFFGEREKRRRRRLLLLFFFLFLREREAASMDSISSNCDLGQFCDPGRIVTRRAVFIDGPNLLPAQEAVRARPGIMNREPTRGLFKIVAIFFFDR